MCAVNNSCYGNAVKGFWALWDNIYDCDNCCHGYAVKQFWTLWDNIYDYVCLLLYISPSLLMGNLLVYNNKNEDSHLHTHRRENFKSYLIIRMFLIATTSRLALWPTQPPINAYSGLFSRR
jgi:hypothetical protein